MSGDVEQWLLGAVLSRRQLLRRGAGLGLGLAGLSPLLASCGGDSEGEGAATGATTEELSGTIVMINYPSWMGKNEVANFQKDTGVKVKEVAGETESIAGTAGQVQQNPDAYDFLLGDESLVAQLDASGLVAELDFTKIPNIKLVEQKFRDDYPKGIPTDFGKVGLGYRKDLMAERPTSWADVWRLAPKYSGKIVFLGLDRDVMGSTLKYLGFSGNTENEDELEKCKDALIEIKPHIQAFLSTDVTKSLIKGSAVMTMTWDFDIALAQQKEPNIEWVAPEEGMVAYLEGWIGVSKTDKLAEVEAFMNFHLEPRNYADFVNTTGTAYVEPEATQFINKSIAENPIIAFDKDILARVEFEKFLGEATAAWNRVWDEVQAA
jgi:spermidine/putrescine transport system substrate-binding protein